MATPLKASSSKPKILLYCVDVVGKNMAGPAIRYWEFAKALSAYYEVILSTPNKPDISSDRFLILPRQHITSLEHLTLADLIITQHISNKMALKAKMKGIRIIYDAYAPAILENLEIFRDLPSHLQTYQNQLITSVTHFSMKMADAVICASSRQRDLWTGTWLGLKQLTPERYHQDASLSALQIVPFGLPDVAPTRSGKGLREIFNLDQKDIVLLWGGGIWNWFDPLTLLHAVKHLADQGYPVRLVFMGVKHPNESIPAMKMAAETLHLARKLNLLDKHLFFNFGWTPYEQRQSFLLDADIGVSTHFETLETRYAFRTRILDYIWAELPIICTEGDCFAELIERRKLGIVVPYRDSLALSEAIRKMIDNSEQRAEMRANLQAIKPQFVWEEVVKPICAMIDSFSGKPAEKFALSDFQAMLQHLWEKKNPAMLWRKLAKIF